MYYYEVLAAHPSYHGDGLTYSSSKLLQPGSVVGISLRRNSTLGIVLKKVPKPTFATKPIDSGAVHAQPLPKPAVDLIEWLQHYYPAPGGSIGSLFVPRQLPKRPTEIVIKPAVSPLTLPPLTAEQRAALDTIQKGTSGTYLIHGDTGTGKTRVYIEAARTALNSGRSVLLLIPEISLSPQLVANFRESLADYRVIITNSHLTPVARGKVWLDVLSSSEPVVLVGPRSALFYPLNNIGLIVMDEVHETAYKQEQAPYYQASRVAAQLARLHHASLIMGSATPLVADYYVVQEKNLPIIRMTQQAVEVHTTKAAIDLVDLRDKTNFSLYPQLSVQLIEALRSALTNQEQALVFLNRRGTARLIICQNCGWQASCPRCDVPLTYHGDEHRLRCHTCGYHTGVPSQCPACATTDILFRSMGTKALAEELQRIFPNARIKRFDTDNLKADRIEAQYANILEGEVDILVGTQLLAKGLDLPRLSVVGVVAADSSLYFPDYTAEERTYQLLSQVIGRVGRGHRPGTAVIQTYNPDSPAIQAAIHKNWQVFYEQQLQERKEFRFPPFCYLLKLTCRRATAKAAEKATHQYANFLRTQGDSIEVVGPTPSFQEKINGKFQWQLIVKSTSRSLLTNIITSLPSGWNYDLDPTDLL